MEPSSIIAVIAAKSEVYDTVNKEQNSSLMWLIEALEAELSLTADDVYAHGKIGYKQPSEGSTAQWKKP